MAHAGWFAARRHDYLHDHPDGGAGEGLSIPVLRR
jgi:hypothetical protein